MELFENDDMTIIIWPSCPTFPQSGDCSVLEFLWLNVKDGKHIMSFQSEYAVFKFLRRIAVDRTLIYHALDFFRRWNMYGPCTIMCHKNPHFLTSRKVTWSKSSLKMIWRKAWFLESLTTTADIFQPISSHTFKRYCTVSSCCNSAWSVILSFLDLSCRTNEKSVALQMILMYHRRL